MNAPDPRVVNVGGPVLEGGPDPLCEGRLTPPLRVLMVSDVSPLDSTSGAERVLWEQASRLARRGHRVTIVSRSPAGEPGGTVEREGVRIRHFPVNRRSSLRFLWTAIREARRAAADELAEAGADVLQVHQPLSGYGVLRGSVGQRIPSLYTFLSPAPLEYRSRRGLTAHHRAGWPGDVATAVLWAIEGSSLRRATRIHVLSEFSAEQLRKMYRMSRDRIVMIPGGADTERFQPASDRGTVRQAFGLPERAPVLSTLRNLEARMGLDILIRAMATLRLSIPGVLLLIGGEGSLRRPLESLAASLDLQDCVRFLGFVPEERLPLLYQAADVFVLPTRELEGFGLATVEALACGTPVLGTAVGATPEILRPLHPSLLFRGTTPEAMAEDLRRFLEVSASEPEACRRLRQACRRHAETHYAWPVSVSRLEGALGDLAAARTTPPTRMGPPA